jgi:hypothetical protein
MRFAAAVLSAVMFGMSFVAPEFFHTATAAVPRAVADASRISLTAKRHDT